MRPRNMVPVVALIGTLMAPAGAEAYADKSDAALFSRVEISEYADHICGLSATCEWASYPRLTKFDCVRVRRTTVHCDGEVALNGYDFTEDRSCLFMTSVNERLRVRIVAWDCE